MSNAMLDITTREEIPEGSLEVGTNDLYLAEQIQSLEGIASPEDVQHLKLHRLLSLLYAAPVMPSWQPASSGPPL